MTLFNILVKTNIGYHQSKKSGFTIIELMIYISIVGLLIAGLVGGFAGFLERGRRSSTTQAIKSLQNALLSFQSEYFKYPKQLNDLVEKPKTDLGKKWHPTLEKLPKDGWGNEFVYKVTPNGKHPYELYSTGGVEDEDSDAAKDSQINVWEI